MAAWAGTAPVAGLQEVPRASLGEPVAAYEDGLGSMRGVRELPDGRVLIADGFGEALIVWRPGAGADTLTNVGQGPEEYRLPDGLFPLPDGGTLLIDLGNARLTRIEADLGFGETWPIARGGLGAGMTMMIAEATDRNGRIYYEERLGGMMSESDSAAIMRFDPASGETAEVGRIRLSEQERRESGDANNRNISIRPVPFSAEEGTAGAVLRGGRVERRLGRPRRDRPRRRVPPGMERPGRNDDDRRCGAPRAGADSRCRSGGVAHLARGRTASRSGVRWRRASHVHEPGPLGGGGCESPRL
ncbi:hypothetical protein [Candidatus Palauibacter sp.]|uniref:hypothetical protein n=1 Tax=Candidatus Palauibacter sp. TaxID=3101350 RepID=UPI003C6F03CF